MRFELDSALTDDILFCMENQDGEFVLDTCEGRVIDVNNNDDDGKTDDVERFIPLPEWSPSDGFRLMEKFAASLRNPVLRHELSAALGRNKGVFRSFKNVLEQYPETAKLWYSYKDCGMKREVTAWYNALREEWGLAPIGGEPEDTSSLILEDFIIRKGTRDDFEKAAALHKLCAATGDKAISDVYESMNSCPLNDEFFFVAETANGDFSGCICAAADAPETARIFALEVKSEYRALGLGKALLSKLLEQADEQKLAATIDLPADSEYFARSLLMEDFKPCVQRFARPRKNVFPA